MALPTLCELLKDSARNWPDRIAISTPTGDRKATYRDRDYPKDHPPRLRFIRSCSAALAPTVLRELEAAFSAPVIPAYGMTETAHQATPAFPVRRKGPTTATSLPPRSGRGDRRVLAHTLIEIDPQYPAVSGDQRQELPVVKDELEAKVSTESSGPKMGREGVRRRPAARAASCRRCRHRPVRESCRPARTGRPGWPGPARGPGGRCHRAADHPA